MLLNGIMTNPFVPAVIERSDSEIKPDTKGKRAKKNGCHEDACAKKKRIVGQLVGP
jgi:hypothetical protein